MYRRAIHAFAVCLIALASLQVLSCQVAKVVREPPPHFEALENCLKPAFVPRDAKEKRQCIYLLEAFLHVEPDHARADEAAFRLGQFYLETGDYSAAYHLFDGFPGAHPKSRKKAQARLYLGVSLYFLGNPAASLDVLHALAESPEAAPWASEIFRYIAENYAKLQNLPYALTWYARCYESIKEEAGRERLQARVLDVMSLGWEPEALQAAAERFPAGFFSEAIRLGVAATYVQRGQLRLAEDHLTRMSLQHPADVFTGPIQALLERVAGEGPPRICTVGCLLPLTGKHGRFGRSVLDAVLLGARAFRSPEEKGSSIRLVIRDTQGDPEVAVRHLKELAEDPNVVGLVGPLVASVAFACAEEAQKYRIPMITLTQREEVARVGDFIFQNGLTMRQQIDTLVEFVMEEMALASFAVLYPKDAYGMHGRDLFESKVLEMGGELVAAVSYEQDETDFQDEIRLLVGQEFLAEKDRREEKRALRRLADQGLGVVVEDGQTEDPWARGEEEMELGEEEPILPPFEVLFIPDHYRKVALIAPHLAFYDVNEITLLGTNAWNSIQLVELAGEYVRDAVFADGFFAESNMPNVREFVEQYLRAFQTVPRVLEALGYDSVLMLEDSFLRAQPKTRDRVRDALANMDSYPGLSGYTHFKEDGSAKKRVYILSIVGNRIQQIH